MQCSSHFWVCGQIPVVWPFKGNLFGSTFAWYHLFFNIFKLKFGILFFWNFEVWHSWELKGYDSHVSMDSSRLWDFLNVKIIIYSLRFQNVAESQNLSNLKRVCLGISGVPKIGLFQSVEFWKPCKSCLNLNRSLQFNKQHWFICVISQKLMNLRE